MQDIAHNLTPAERTWNPIYGISKEESLGGKTMFFDGTQKSLERTDYETVIIGVPEDGNSFDKNNCSKSPYIIRCNLYGLRGINGQKLLDAGNIKGKTIKESYYALQEIAEWFLKKNKTIIVIGGSHDLTVPLFDALETVKNKISITVCDAMIDLDIEGKNFSSRAWLNKLNRSKKDSLEDLTLTGIQNYLISENLENKIRDRYFDIIRLSELRGNGIKKSEIPLRDSDLFSFDFRAIKGKYSFSQDITSPHGLEPYEACKMCHYAGLSCKLSVLGLFETSDDNPENQNNSVLAAQMIWHFIEGLSGRYYDIPSQEDSRYKKFVVFLEIFGKDVQFYNNQLNGRWWFEVPTEQGDKKIFSCDHEDYLKAMENELPDKFWRLYMNINKIK